MNLFRFEGGEQMPRFYTTEGTIIDNVQDFISLYSNEYIAETHEGIVKGIHQTPSVVENDIINLFDKDVFFSDFKGSLIKIMAWKLGAINQTDNNWVKWDCNNSEITEVIIKRGNYKPIDGRELNAFLSALNDSKAYFMEIQEWTEVYRKLMSIFENNNVKSFGVTYMLTLLYFLTFGKCPIYDKYAQKAMSAINNGISPVGKPPIEYCVPGKECITRGYGIYRTYMDDLNTLFDYQQIVTDNRFGELRRIDQALWVYGHLFSDAN